MLDNVAYKSAAELEDILSNINEMQDKVLDVYSKDCHECVKLLRDLNSLKEEARCLYKKFEKNI